MAETTKRCQVKMHDGKPCGRELYDDEHCLFHSKKEDKDAGLFQMKLDEIFRDESLKILDFSWFVFPERIHFPPLLPKPVTFRSAIFLGSVAFWSMHFLNESDFGDVVFEADVILLRCIFKHGADFSHVNFKGRVFFGNMEIDRKLDFSGAVFEDSLVMSPVIDSEEKAFSAGADFVRVIFFKPETVQFFRIDLSHFTFLETDITRVHFTDVEWNREKGRNTVFDEVRPETNKRDYPLVAQLYRRLRANYEGNLRYSEAGDFYIGEMEMTRKAEKNIFKKLPLLFYKAISNYGESYYRPLGWIALILLIFPFLFMFADIQPVSLDPSSPMQDVIHYRLDFSSRESFLPTTEKISDYYTSFLYSMSVFSFIRDKKYTTIDNWGHTLFVLESILSPVTLAFFLLALRRRFKR